VLDMGHRPLAWTRRVAPLLVAAGAVALAIPSLAMATTRYAAPGGTAPDTMRTTPDTACSIGAAAGGPDVTAADEAVIQPGHYSDADLNGDKDQPANHSVSVTAGSVHGEIGDRPVIGLTGEGGFDAFVVGAGTTLSDLEVDATDYSGIVFQTGGVVERVIAATDRDGSVPCSVEPATDALLRDSLCFSGGEDSSAVGSEIFNQVGTHTLRLRNVTAVATKPDSDGIFIEGRGAGTTINVDAKSVIARGDMVDVLAEAFSTFDPPQPNTGANVTITLDHSNYVNWSARSDSGGGMAAVTPAGTGTNQTGAVVLQADDYHQVADPNSSTIEKGAVDAFSGTTDIDGQNRTIGLAPDIGADELGFPTSTAIACTPNPVQFETGPVLCRVTVTDTTSPPPVMFRSSVRLTSERFGEFGGNCEELGMTSPTQGMCMQPYLPGGPGPDRLTARFPGDDTHDPSEGSDLLDVTTPSAAMPQTPGRRAKCKKRKRKHRAEVAKKAKKKCKKRKKRR
jgi:hypothetical protein